MAFRRLTPLVALVTLLLSASSAIAGDNSSWTITGGPTGGFVNALVAAANAPGVLFAGTNGGVYVTRDAGARWQLASDGLPDDRTIYALATTADARLAFAGTASGIYRTRDAGAHWTADARLVDQVVLSLILDPHTPTTVYAGTTRTVFKSTNGGDTWIDIGQELHSVQVWSLALSLDSSTLYAATDTGIFSSADLGTHWTRSSDGLPAGTGAQALAVNARGLLVGTTQGLFRSKDGKSWSPATGPLSGVLVRPLAVDPQQPDRVLAVTASGIFSSTDGGSVWIAVSDPFGNTPVLSLAFGDNQAWYIGTAHGIWKATAGVNWQPLNTGLASSSISALVLLPGTPDMLLAATRYGLWTSSDYGGTWKQAQGLADLYVLSLAADPSSHQIVYAGTGDGSVFVSRDSGAAFAPLAAKLATHAPVSSLAVRHLMTGTTSLIAGTPVNGAYRSDDEGRTWRAYSAGLGETARVSTLAWTERATLYAGTDRGLFRSDPSNPAARWQFVSTLLPVDETRQVIADPLQANTLYAVFALNGLYRSSDGGGSWSSVGRGAFPTRVRFHAIAPNPGNPHVLYAGTDRGLYRSENDGAAWSVVSVGLPAEVGVQAIVVNAQAPRQVFAGTLGNGVLAGTDDLPMPKPPWLNLPILGTTLLVLGLGAGLVWRVKSCTGTPSRGWVSTWPQWDATISFALWNYGQANETNMGRTPRRSLLPALQHYMDLHPNDGLTLQTAPVALRLDNYLAAQRFLSHWKAAWEVGDSEDAFASVTGPMVDQLCKLLGFNRVTERSYKGLIGYVVRAPTLKIKIPMHFPIIFLPCHEVTEEDVQALRDLLGVLSMTGYFALIVDLRDAPDTDQRQSLKLLVRQTLYDFIVLDGMDMRNLLAARDHSQRLIELILDQVDLTVVSPYVTSGPVSENMFFGREYEIKTIMRTVHDTNYAIIGGRKIGKTSVLARVYRRLLTAADCQPLYLDCQAVQDDAGFFEAVNTLWPTPVARPTPEGFRRMVTELQTRDPNRQIVMLFDEIDHLLRHDIAHGEHLFRIMRALSQENRVRFVFCGEKELSHALRNAQLAFFNFCDVLSLSYLTPAEAKRVVTEPMQAMGIDLEDGEALADHIVTLTAGHPNIVQYLCQKLIERIHLRQQQRIRRVDVDALSQSAQFTEYFATTSWGNANTLERFMTLIMLDRPEVTIGEMAGMLRDHALRVSPAQLESALDGLCLYSILRRDGPKYEFAAEAFPSVLRRSKDVGGLLTSLVQEIQTLYGDQP